MNENLEKCKLQNWYPKLAAFSLPTLFVSLQEDEVRALADGADAESEIAQRVLPRLRQVMNSTNSYNRFLSVDLVAPVDSERFKTKRGAVRSAYSGWNILAGSERVRESAKRGEVTNICVRPFRRMDIAREFRLFIKGGKLFAMSQYWLVKHFPKLEKMKELYWEKAATFVSENAWALPIQDVVADVYFTSSGRTLIMDLNVLEDPTDPKMFNSWDNFNWSGDPAGIKIVPPPHTLNGDVNVSF